MSDALLAACAPGEVRILVWRDGEPLDAAIWRPGAPDGVGDRHRGRLVALAPRFGGAFVALEGGATGFLPLREGAGLTEGQALGVRVARAAQGGKGPRLEPAPDVPAAGPAPLLLSRGIDPLRRLAALHPDLPVLVDDAALAAALRPDLGDRVRRVAAAFGEAEASAIEALAEPELPLPGGGRATLHPTPALVAIDVDSGAGAAGPNAAREAQRAASRAAIPAIARAIRLRNLSGAILIDFAGMSARQRRHLGPDLAAALAADPLSPRLLGFTALGLAEVLRPRVHPPWHEAVAGPHAAGLAALRALAARAAAAPARPLALRAAPAVVGALQADPVALPDLAGRLGRNLILRSDPALAAGSWAIEEAG